MSKFTENQKKAVETTSGNILVSAGAGSGKTFVLVERIIRMLKEGVEINSLLVLTFTKAAAGEMKERIIKYLEKTPELKAKIPEVQTAEITTFDAYLLNIVKTYGYKINIPSNIKIGDDGIMQNLLEQSVEEVFEKYYQKTVEENFDKENKLLQSNADTIKDFLINYSDFSDSNLKKIFIQLHNKYQTILEIDKLEKKNQQKHLENQFSRYEQNLIKKNEKINQLIKKLNNVPTCENGKKTLQTYNDKLMIDISFKCIQYDQLLKLTDIRTENKVTKIRANAKIENKEELIKIQEQIKTIMDEIKETLIPKKKEEILTQEMELFKYKELILESLNKINEIFFEKKKERNIYQYADITNLALEILSQQEIKEKLQNKYHEILIDEYQDTNDFHNKIVELLSNKNLYLVGDLKQSIYRFRNANPKIFNELQIKYEQKNEGEAIVLSDNFRSREEVLSGINLVFEEIMNIENAKIDYTKNHALDYGNKMFEQKNEKQNNFLEFYMYETEYLKEYDEDLDFPTKYSEALLIGKDILEKINSQYKILDNGTLRNATFSDFTILTRTKDKYKLYEEVFNYLNIPIIIQQERRLNLQDSFELITLLSIFKLILNPQNKQAMMSVCRSFLFSLDEQMIHDYITQEKTSEEIEKILQKIEKLKKENNISLNLLYNMILREFDYTNKMLSLENQESLFINLSKIQELTIEFDSQGETLATFIEHLDYILENQKDIKIEIPSELKTTNAAHVMTIFKSKGLEFPVVYLSELDKALVKQSKELISLNQELGIIMPSIKSRVKRKSFLRHLEKMQMQEEEIEEAIRIIYVGMTRASEKIIIVSNKEKLDEKEVKESKKIQDILSNVIQKFSDYQKHIEIFSEEELKKFSEYQTEQKLNQKEKSQKNFDLKNLQYEEINQKIEVLSKQKISKEQQRIATVAEQKSIKLGIKIHNFLELINFIKIQEKEYQQKIFSMLKQNNSPFNEYEQKLIQKIIIDIIEKLQKIEIKNFWTEYEFLDTTSNQTKRGIIDLLIQTADSMLIIDYKLDNIDSPEYIRQIGIYSQFIKSMTKLPVKSYLYSLLKQEVKEVKKFE